MIRNPVRLEQYAAILLARSINRRDRRAGSAQGPNASGGHVLGAAPRTANDKRSSSGDRASRIFVEPAE